jgi:hypothetical protein
MYTAFERTLLSDKGKALVREHTIDYDAQTVFKDLSAYALQSTKATLDSSIILTYITSSRLGDETWKGVTQAYLLHWQDQVRKYKDLIPKEAHFVDQQKLTMFENAVSSIPDLRQVQIQAAHDKVRTGKSITYDQYVSLLLSGAMIHDSSLGDIQPGKSRSQRQVYHHDLHSAPSQDTRQIYSQDIDTDVNYGTSSVTFDEWEVYNASYNNGPRLSKDQWSCLPPEAHTKWDELSPESKHIIMEAKIRHSHPRPPRKANLHDITRADLDNVAAYDFIQAHLHELQMDDTPSTLSEPASNYSSGHSPNDRTLNVDDSQKLLAHLTKCTTLPPGDLQRVLSSSINNPKTIIPPPNTDIHINGKTYRQVNTAKTLYVASDHRTVRRGALVDRGANGGIAGDDVLSFMSPVDKSMSKGSIIIRLLISPLLLPVLS